MRLVEKVGAGDPTDPAIAVCNPTAKDGTAERLAEIDFWPGNGILADRTAYPFSLEIITCLTK